jgi:hypothetical protein
LSQRDSWISSGSGSGGAPRSTQNSEKDRCRSPTCLRPERVPLASVVERQTGEGGRQLGVLQLERVARDDPHPRATARRDRGETYDVVLHDDVRRHLVEDLRKSIVDVSGTVHERLPSRPDELAQLVECALAEDRRRVADEVLPELARLLGFGRRRRESHRPLLEALSLERPRERLLHDEDDPVPAPAQHIADADAVVRRPEGALREEDHHSHCAEPNRRVTGFAAPPGAVAFGSETE